MSLVDSSVTGQSELHSEDRLLNYQEDDEARKISNYPGAKG